MHTNYKNTELPLSQSKAQDNKKENAAGGAKEHFLEDKVQGSMAGYDVLQARQPISFPQPFVPENISAKLSAQRQTKQDSGNELQIRIEQLKDKQLQQGHFLFGKRELTLRGIESLHIRESTLLRTDEISIPLWQLRAGASFTKQFSLRWSFASLLSLCATIALAAVLLYGEQALWSYALLLIPSLATAYSVYQFMEYSYDLVVYKHAESNSHMLYLWNKRPSKTRLQAFLHSLDERILLSQSVLVDTEEVCAGNCQR